MDDFERKWILHKQLIADFKKKMIIGAATSITLMLALVLIHTKAVLSASPTPSPLLSFSLLAGVALGTLHLTTNRERLILENRNAPTGHE